MNRRAFLTTASFALVAPVVTEIKLPALVDFEFGTGASSLTVKIDGQSFTFSMFDLMNLNVSFPGLNPELAGQLMSIIKSAVDKLWEEELRLVLFGNGDPKMAIEGLV